MDSRHAFRRIIYFQDVCQIAEAANVENRDDPQNLTNWAEALIELSYYQKWEESRMMVDAAVSKLNKAMSIEPKNHAAVFCMGKANTAYAYLTPDEKKAEEFFNSASKLYEQAVKEIQIMNGTPKD